MRVPLQTPSHTTAGIPCPQCETRIETTIQALLVQSQFECPQCGLVLTLDRGASWRAMTALQELQQAADQVDKVRQQTV